MMLDVTVVTVSDACAEPSEDEHRAELETIIQQCGDGGSVDQNVARLAA